MMPWRAILLLGLTLSGCSILEKFGIGGDPAVEAVASAKQALGSGDLPGGAAALEAAYAANPGSTDAAVGAAYAAYLQGRFEEADGVLAGAAELDPTRVGELTLRRAMVALASGDLDAVRTHGEASALPAGLLMAAEVALADGERDAASTLLQAAKASPDAAVSRAATGYLGLMEDADPRVQGLSEAQALWALGERRVAVRSVEELVKSLPDDRDDKAELMLIWAGRSAAAGEAQVASNLVESIDFPPAGQQWRVIATRAIIACAEGDAERCGSLLDGIAAGAPPEGLADARATAAIMLAEHDAEAAARIAGDHPSASVARALQAAGQGEEAADLVSSGPYARFLSAGGGS
jgi:tetratricopeptide (TPR) repeat protein